MYQSLSFKSSLIPSGTALFFQNFDRARTGFYLHYLFFTSHGCVSECIFYKIFKGKRWRSQFLKSSFSARTRLSHRPPAVNDSEECVRVYFLSGSSAETVSHAFVDKRESEMREHEFHVHHLLFMIHEQQFKIICFKRWFRSSVWTVPHHFFLKLGFSVGIHFSYPRLLCWEWRELVRVYHAMFSRERLIQKVTQLAFCKFRIGIPSNLWLWMWKVLIGIASHFRIGDA